MRWMGFWGWVVERWDGKWGLEMEDFEDIVEM